jgi:hypothetical protein
LEEHQEIEELMKGQPSKGVGNHYRSRERSWWWEIRDWNALPAMNEKVLDAAAKGAYLLVYSPALPGEGTATEDCHVEGSPGEEYAETAGWAPEALEAVHADNRALLLVEEGKKLVDGMGPLWVKVMPPPLLEEGAAQGSRREVHRGAMNDERMDIA